MPNAKEKRYHQRVRELGCCICGDENANVHHIRAGAGMGQKSPERLVIPLCHLHHQGAEGIHHLGTRTWQMAYGDELKHLNDTIGRIADE